MVLSRECSDEVASDVSKKNESPENGCHVKQQNDKCGIQEMQKEEDVAPVTPDKSLRDSNSSAGVSITQLDKEGSISSVTLSKVLQTPGTNSNVLPFGCKSPVIREKMSDDGYHWRKYGQKFVKGNEYVRSYYKCTHPNCRAKKQLERSHDGQSVEIVCFGSHDHPKPEHNVPLAVGFVLSVVEEKAGQPLTTSKQEVNAPHQTKPKSDIEVKNVASIEDVKGVLQESTKMKYKADNDDDVPSKRQKKENQVTEPTPPNKRSGESRVVVQTLSQVDIVNDGYRWRKYGQKMVKGNPNPRSYYRCSSPGCPVKKHVERASHDSKVVITSYEGQHDHDMAPSRMVTHNANSTHSGESGAKSGGSDGTTRLSGNSKELLSASKDDLKGSNVSGSEIVIQSGSGDANKSNETQNGKSNVAEENDTSGTGQPTDTNGSSTSLARSNEQLGEESRIESKANHSSCGVRSINPSSESNPKKHIPNAEPIQS